MLLKDEAGMFLAGAVVFRRRAGEAEAVALTPDRVTYAPGQIIVRQGEAGDALCGAGRTAEVLVDSANGQIKVAEVEPNAIVGEIAILSNQTRTATVRALTPWRRCASARIISCACSAIIRR